jgi:flagellar motor switch protein FliM
MSDLTQEEIDALVREEAGASGDAAGRAAGSGVSALDLTRPERSLRGQLPGLELVLDRLARGLSAALRGYLGFAPAVSVGALELVRFARIVEGLARPMSIQLVRLAPLRGQAVLVVTGPLVGALLEVAFGGSRGRQTSLAERDLSAIELRALERFGARVLQEMQTAWRPVVGLEASLVGHETNPAFVAVPLHELVLQIELRLAVDGAPDLGLSLCVPWAALDPVRDRLAATPGQEVATALGDERWQESMHHLLGETDLELTAELGRRALSLRQVLALKIGDVVALGTGREGPVVVRVEGQPRFLGAPGISGTHHAVRLTAKL